MKYILIVISILLLVSCNPCKQVAKHHECFAPDTIIKVDSIKVKDSVIVIQSDSSFIDMLFECDSNNRVLIKEMNSKGSERIVTKYIFKDNQLKLDIYTDSIATLHRLIERFKNEKVTVKNPVNAKLQNENERLQKKIENRRWLFWWFGISLLILLLLIIFIIRGL